MRTIGFTPLIDELLHEFGMAAAVIYGVVWGACQDSGSYTETQQQLADDLGIARATVNKHLGLLVSHGYLELKTGRPNAYIVTDKVQFELTVSVKKSDTSQNSVKKSDTIEKPSVRNFDTPLIKDDARICYKNSNINITMAGDETPPPKSKTPIGDLRQFVSTLSQVTGVDTSIRSNYGWLAKIAKEVIGAGYTIEQVVACFGKGGRWYEHDWRGKKGQRPRPTDIPREIGKLLAVHEYTYQDALVEAGYVD